VIFEVIGWIGCAASSLISIPQLIRTLRLRRAGELSVTTYAIACFTMVCFIILAVHEWVLQLLCASAVVLIVDIWILVLAVKWRKR
jgi:uncharacterized protein with PQ loop repeat